MGEIVVNSDRKYLLVGLGGSGGKVITKLYERLIRERGEGFKSNVACVAIDTDQDELNDLAQLGVKKIPISGSGNVGQMFNQLGDDVAEWCPNTANEGNFFSSQVFNGASQCRLKSRLCFSNFLKDQNNALAQVLEEFMEVSPTDEAATEAPPLVYIVSSVAGGTGSGIFIQTAFYIKKFFQRYNLHPSVYGLFACPDLYKNVVNPQQLPSLYANAYAVVRELNAFNLICGNETTAAYGGKLELDIEISTECEGKLFEKDAKGRYGDKPYDVLYFIDRVNSLSKILGGLDKYYEAMANIAYSHLYIEISGEVLSGESNEMHARSISPCAIYGSAGAATLRYPFEDMIRYFSNRSIHESFNSVWTELDKMWKHYVDTKDADARASGRAEYVPSPDERADHYIVDFERSADNRGITQSKLSFLMPMTEVNGNSAVEALFESIAAAAQKELTDDLRFEKERENLGLSDPETAQRELNALIDSMTIADDKAGMFSLISDIDKNLEEYCKKGLSYAIDLSISFSNKIFCDDKNMQDTYDEEKCGIVKGLLYNAELKEWVHPVAARYLLYRFLTKLKSNMTALISEMDTPEDDADDFYNYLVNECVGTQRRALSTDNEFMPNADILQHMYGKLFGKKAAKRGVNVYFEELEETLELINEGFLKALLFFSYARVRGRVEALIKEYEFFFDNIDEFIKKAEGAKAAYETMHENSKGIVYVCAGAEVKRALYEKAGRHINMQTGEAASSIGEGLFRAMRDKAARKSRKEKLNHQKEIRGVQDFFQTVSDLVSKSTMNNTEILGAVQMNAFQAILCEYALTYPEHAEDEARYSRDDAAKNRIDQFVVKKLAGLTKMAAPFLMYDVEDSYSGMFKHVDNSGVEVEKPKVANSYRFITHNVDVDHSIRSLVGAVEGEGGVIERFYRGQASDLPKSQDSQTIHIDYVRSHVVDPYSILCYSTVHCLQPYQIYAFDELRGGVYYKHYAQRIADMQSVQRYSMTPHLDKRWHKHGVMPYINVAKEVERRFDLAKAFLYALCYGKISIKKEGSESKLVFQDLNLGRESELIFYKGRSIPANKVNRAMNWFADQEDLIERYSTMFDQAVDVEVEKLSKYSETLGGYKNGINSYARILNQMKRNAFRDLDAPKKTTKSTKDTDSKKTTKKKETKELNSILTFAWKLHLAEENELDKDYAELLVQTLCEVIKKYAMAPYNREAIEKQDKGSDSYRNYLEIGQHISASFLEDFAESVGRKIGLREETAEEADERRRRTSFGRDDSDLSDEAGTLDVKAAKGANEEAILKNKSYEWVCALLDKAFAE